MKQRKSRARVMLLSSLAVAGSITGLLMESKVEAANEKKRFSGPLSSQPLAISADDKLLAVVNPDNDSVSFFRIKNDRNRKIREVAVQREPNGVAFTPDGKKAFVANTVSGTVTVIQVKGNGNGNSDDYDAEDEKHAVADEKNSDNEPNRAYSIGKHIPVGVEPYSLIMSPNGAYLYVANSRSNSVSVIDPETERVVATIPNIGFEPRGMAMTNDGDGDDNDETLYVTQFLALPVAGKVDGADDAKSGRVTVISTASNTMTGTVTLNPIADTGFKANGDALARVAPGADFTFTTGAYPNQLNNIAIYGNYAFVPNTGASPNGPVRFDVNTQSLLHVINRATNADAGRTTNMHQAVAQQTSPVKRFITVPWAIAFKHDSSQGYVISAASNIMIKLLVDPQTGAATVQSDPFDSSRVLQIPTGKNPRGILINSDDTRAYVMNYVSRDVTVIDLEYNQERVLGTMRSAKLPPSGTPEEKIHIGKELYNTSVGVFDPPTAGQAPIVGRMSNNGWGSCSSCHPSGLSDNVVWIFPAGPRRTIPQHADFDPSDPQRLKMRVLNWSANRDEQEDFSLNIRAVSGGAGLIVQADGVTPDPNVNDFTPLANAGRNQLKVRGVGAWDAIKAYVQFGIRAPISPVSKTEPDVIAGAALFRTAGCHTCHGGAQWTTSRVNFTPPPAAALISNGQVIGELKKVGTFDPNAQNEIRQNAAPPLGADGFVPPSLMSIFAFPRTFLHNGAVDSLTAVLDNVTHRSAGTAGVDTLTNPADRAKIVRLLESIDAASPPIQ